LDRGSEEEEKEEEEEEEELEDYNIQTMLNLPR
jgi:hypothetical protein